MDVIKRYYVPFFVHYSFDMKPLKMRSGQVHENLNQALVSPISSAFVNYYKILYLTGRSSKAS